MQELLITSKFAPTVPASLSDNFCCFYGILRTAIRLIIRITSDIQDAPPHRLTARDIITYLL